VARLIIDNCGIEVLHLPEQQLCVVEITDKDTGMVYAVPMQEDVRDGLRNGLDPKHVVPADIEQMKAMIGEAQRPRAPRHDPPPLR
jgi:hypothetical protein